MARKPDVDGVLSPVLPEQAAEIRDVLERLLSSHQFRGSRRCQILLRHITEQTLGGDTRTLKERTLGMEVFGRPAGYDTSQDPIVRSTAAEIRKKLAQYYQEPGRDSEARIDLLSGSYIAEFHFNPPPPTLESEPQAGRHPRRMVALAGGLGALVLAVAAFLLLPTRHTDLDRFWGPILKSPGSVLICLGQPITYNLRSSAAQDAIQALGSHPEGNPSDEGVIHKKDLVILRDRYVDLSDAVCMVRLITIFERHGKPYRIRGDRTTSFADLRETPAVLIAAFDNQWALRVAGQLRFIFVKDSEHDTDLIRDTQQPQRNDWRLTGAWPYWDVSTDYAVISRVTHGPTDHPVILSAGITEYGTAAAGEFLSSPEYFAEAVRKLDRGWENRNVQIVLRVPVVGRIPGHAQVIATHVW